jgi:tRNA threonylcarbamoyladenosine modification (KEOPS) complex  Pcc1 subunit
MPVLRVQDTVQKETKGYKEIKGAMRKSDFVVGSETTFEMKSAKIAEQVIAAIRPEMEFDKKRTRSDVEVIQEGNIIRVRVKAKDVSAFRSTMNTYSKIIQVSKGLIEDDRKKGHK